jgi:hypothetical protein
MLVTLMGLLLLVALTDVSESAFKLHTKSWG